MLMAKTGNAADYLSECYSFLQNVTVYDQTGRCHDAVKLSGCKMVVFHFMTAIFQDSKITGVIYRKCRVP